MSRRILIIATVSVIIGSSLVQRVHEPHVSAQTARTSAPTPPCNEGALPGAIKIVPDGNASVNKAKLARKRFYLASFPFNLANTVSLTTAPTVKTYYTSAGASPQLISWLENNHCETVYCRALMLDEAKCENNDASKCVPEFNAAYRAALADLKGDANLALKMITNYAPLSDPKLRIGFYQAREEWFNTSIAKIEGSPGNNNRLRSTVTDKDGIGFFYDLCPGAYFVSSVAPIDIDGVAMIWEATKPIQVDGPPQTYDATKVTLQFTPRKQKNAIVGKPLSDFVKPPDK